MAEEKSNLWALNISSDDFEGWYSSKEEALKGAIHCANWHELPDDTLIEIGRIYWYVPEIDEDMIIEYVQNYAYSEDLNIEDWLVDIPNKELKILRERLTKTFNDWLEEFNHEPNFWYVKDVEEYTLGELYEKE